MRFVRWKQRETETEREEGRDNQNKDCNGGAKIGHDTEGFTKK